MITIERAAVLSVCTCVIATVGFVGVSARPAPAATPASRAPIMEGISLDVYDAWQRSMVVQADRAYASTKRWGFLQTGLVPMLELEDVVITTFHPDGTTEQARASTAVIDWSNKHLLEIAGTPPPLDK